jgi:hypothetical protein
MNDNTYTEDLSRFGFREIKMLSEILNAWVKDGLPDDFSNDEVKPAMNMNSGNVFLVNSDYQVAMMNGDKLESFYSTPYDGHEGFYDELIEQYSDMNSEDQEYMRSIAESLGKDLPEVQS